MGSVWPRSWAESLQNCSPAPWCRTKDQEEDFCIWPYCGLQGFVVCNVFPFCKGKSNLLPWPSLVLGHGPDFSVSLKPWWDTCPQPPLDQSLGSDVPKAAAPGFHCIENKSQTLPQVCTAVCGDATKATQRGPVSACHTPKYSVLLLGRWESSNEFFLYQAINIIYRRSERISIVVLTANLVAASNEELFGRGR